MNPRLILMIILIAIHVVDMGAQKRWGLALAGVVLFPVGVGGGVYSIANLNN